MTNMRSVQCLQVLRFHIASAECLDLESIELVTSEMQKASVQRPQSREESPAQDVQALETTSPEDTPAPSAGLGLDATRKEYLHRSICDCAYYTIA